MNWLIFLVVYFSSLFSTVCSLGLNITTLVGNTAVVQWTRAQDDPDPLAFDLRFVIPPYTDVGLAQANICPSSSESSGNLTVEFPKVGRFVLVAVSGQQNSQIGQTTVIEVPGSTTVPTPSQTPTPVSIPPSPSKSLMAAEDSPDRKAKVNVPAIVFAVLGGVALTALLIFAVFYFRRRRSMPDKRISFHGERMVQQRSSDGMSPSVGRFGEQGGAYAFTGPHAALGSTRHSSRDARPHDIEQGLAIPPPAMTSLPIYPSGSRPSTPLASGYTVPPPRGPRAKSVKRIESPRVTHVSGEPTSRQRQLADKLAKVEKQIEEIKLQPKPRPSTVIALDDLKMQKAWLINQQNSMWALEEIDTLPPGYSRYMT